MENINVTLGGPWALVDSEKFCTTFFNFGVNFILFCWLSVISRVTKIQNGLPKFFFIHNYRVGFFTQNRWVLRKQLNYASFQRSLLPITSTSFIFYFIILSCKNRCWHWKNSICMTHYMDVKALFITIVKGDNILSLLVEHRYR